MQKGLWNNNMGGGVTDFREEVNIYPKKEWI